MRKPIALRFVFPTFWWLIFNHSTVEIPQCSRETSLIFQTSPDELPAIDIHSL